MKRRRVGDGNQPELSIRLYRREYVLNTSFNLEDISDPSAPPMVFAALLTPEANSKPLAAMFHMLASGHSDPVCDT